ncbi:hypothetical protein Q5P01_007301 [Channa striata]|uniref:Uncharacterized protein n=1 Tax=Channa striata TaxID=64152 RepID=A0AA88N3E4_CHASR|nr:hypothetical protein Q5P01_007301 [Channa striata]
MALNVSCPFSTTRLRAAKEDTDMFVLTPSNRRRELQHISTLGGREVTTGALAQCGGGTCVCLCSLLRPNLLIPSAQTSSLPPCPGTLVVEALRGQGRPQPAGSTVAVERAPRWGGERSALSRSSSPIMKV